MPYDAQTGISWQSPEQPRRGGFVGKPPFVRRRLVEDTICAEGQLEEWFFQRQARGELWWKTDELIAWRAVVGQEGYKPVCPYPPTVSIVPVHRVRSAMPAHVATCLDCAHGYWCPVMDALERSQRYEAVARAYRNRAKAARELEREERRESKRRQKQWDKDALQIYGCTGRPVLRVVGKARS